ncbi:hypothetical protein MMC27_003933 [Xylographa pallens]|nr:hypothetical protein [Xylographa pallens]
MVLPTGQAGGSSNSASTELPPYDPSNPLDITTPILREVRWSANTPPHILGRLDPPAEWYNEKVVTYMQDAAGNVVLDGSGNPIREFGIPMPRYLSSKLHKLEAWRLEAYFRSSKAFTYRDMWARQPSWVQPPTTRGTNVIGNMLGRRGRDPFNARCWSLKHSKKPSKAAVKLMEQLTQAQLDHNTTWVVTRAGIHPPKLPSFLIPLDSFTEEGFPHTPSTEVQTALTESRRLMQLARTNGKTSWHELESIHLPLRWISSKSHKVAKPEPSTARAIKPAVNSKRRVKARSETSEDAEGDTYELFMAVEESEKDTTTKQLPFRNSHPQGLYEGQLMQHNILNTYTTEARNEGPLETENWHHDYRNLHGGAHYWCEPQRAGAIMQDERSSTRSRIPEQETSGDMPTSFDLFEPSVHRPSLWEELDHRQHIDVMTNPYSFEMQGQYPVGRDTEDSKHPAIGSYEMEDQEYFQRYPNSYAGPSLANQFGNAGWIPLQYDAPFYAPQTQQYHMTEWFQSSEAEPQGQSYNQSSLSGDNGDNSHEYVIDAMYSPNSDAAGREDWHRRYSGIGPEGSQDHSRDAVPPSQFGTNVEEEPLED